VKILVFDDKKVHLVSALRTLVGHDLVVVSTYDEAQKALVSEVDYDRAEELLPGLLVEAGLSATFNPHREDKDVSEADKAKYWVARQKSQDMATNRPDFDVVLTDLLVPASRQAQGDVGRALVGKEMPLGTIIALLALVAGVKKVAVVTDMNHHNHPASAAFDCFGKCKLPGVNIICTNRAGMVNIDEETEELVDVEFLRDDKHNDTAEGLKKYPYVGPDNWGPRKGLGQGKNWGEILKQLMGEV